MRHPRERRSSLGDGRGASLFAEEMSRRDLLRRVGAGMTLGGLLAACGGSGGGAAGGDAQAVPLPRLDNPVRWPIFSDNKPIASGLEPETGGTLQIYNWVSYLNEAVVKNFCKKYHCSYAITTFNTMSEAIAKLGTGQFQFDIFFPTIDVIGALIESRTLRPLNHDYIPNMANVWPDYRDPFYDEGWQYTTPYTIYTTGMAWRKDKVSLQPSWAMPWQSGSYKGKVAVLDDYRSGIALALMKSGIFNLNTTNTSQIQAAGRQLQDLVSLVDVRIDNNDYTDVPSGKTWVHEAWSGDILASPYYLPKGTPDDVVGYWFPSNLEGPCQNDLMTIPASGKNPVLAHLFINYLLDIQNAFENFSYTLYQQPITAMTAARLTKEGLIPPSLRSCVVSPQTFKKGIMMLELPASADAVWEQSWLSFSKGL